MEIWLSRLPHIFLIAAGIVVVSLLSLLGYQIAFDSQKKAVADKVLLKQLLESFGLEIPAELKEQTDEVIKSIKPTNS